MISIPRTDCRPLSLRHASNLLQALAHPIRLQILDVLRRGDGTVGDIVDELALAQPVVSRHLGVLRREGVVSVEKRGRERIYRLGAGRARPLLEALFGPNRPSDDGPSPEEKAA